MLVFGDRIFEFVSNWSTPLTKYARQIGSFFPRDRGEKKNETTTYID